MLSVRHGDNSVDESTMQVLTRLRGQDHEDIVYRTEQPTQIKEQKTLSEVLEFSITIQ